SITSRGMAAISATIGSIRAGATTFIAADLDARADIRIRRSHAATVTAGKRDATMAAIATATIPSDTATTRTATTATSAATDRRTRIRTTIAPASARATRRVTATRAVSLGASAIPLSTSNHQPLPIPNSQVFLEVGVGFGCWESKRVKYKVPLGAGIV